MTQTLDKMGSLFEHFFQKSVQIAHSKLIKLHSLPYIRNMKKLYYRINHNTGLFKHLQSEMCLGLR